MVPPCTMSGDSIRRDLKFRLFDFSIRHVTVILQSYRTLFPKPEFHDVTSGALPLLLNYQSMYVSMLIHQN